MIDFKIKGRGFQPVNERWWPATQKQWGSKLLEDNRKFWPQERDPNTGRPWKALSPKYEAWKSRSKPGQPILRYTGRMQNSAKIVPKGAGLEVQTTAYGKYQQFGTSRLVARPWMGVPNTSMKTLSDLAWKNILSTKAK
jgi:hypothetical protein